MEGSNRKMEGRKGKLKKKEREKERKTAYQTVIVIEVQSKLSQFAFYSSVAI